MNDALNLEPLTDKILLEPVEVERSVGGVWLPGTAKNGSFRGVVKAMGPGGYDKKNNRPIPMPNIAIGDTVIYRSWAGSALCQETIFGGKKLLVVEPADVLAKVL